MADAFELTDICMYVIGISLILPVVKSIGLESPWAIVLLLVLLLPLPLYVARFRFRFPAALDAALGHCAFALLCIGFICLIASVLFDLYRFSLAG